MKQILLTLMAVLALPAAAQQTDTLASQRLGEVTVTARRQGTVRMRGAENGVKISREELFRAACCNLGESFTTNPSVDVSYSDAATGAKQIRLLGLSGTYVQMLTENMPNLRLAAAPYALDYVPGPWMQSIQVSKGASSVRNGYESITGQIDIEYLKPDDDQGLTVNLYGNSLSRTEANADANVHLDAHLSTELLAHYQHDYGHHDENDDGFLDQPRTHQWNLQNRWKWRGDRYIFHGGLGIIKEQRDGGQMRMRVKSSELSDFTSAHSTKVAQLSTLNSQPYQTRVETDRYEAYMKHALVLNSEHGTNVALMGKASMHQQAAEYGHKWYNVNEKNAYAQLMFETNFTEQHSLSAGLSINYDYLSEECRVERLELSDVTSAHSPNVSQLPTLNSQPRETTPGIYAQYTYTLGTRLTAMAGLRADHSSCFGTFVTPRLHLKFTPTDVVSLRLSAGKGYRSPHALAENVYLLAMGRQLVVDPLEQEEAWNYGASAAMNIPIGRRTLKLNAEYYYTDFLHQAIVDYDTDPAVIRLTNLDGDSYSHTFQVDATYPLVEGLTVTAAWRLNDVKMTFGHRLMEKPLTSRYKGLLSASYKTPLGLWQFDVTMQFNGGGRLPTAVDGSDRFHAYEQLQAQVTRWFRHFSIYVGGENLTARRQRHPVLGADDPWGAQFDATQVWGPVHGAVAYVGTRINFGRL